MIDEAFITNGDQILGYDSTLPSDVRQWANFDDQYSYDLDSNQDQKTTEFGTDQTVDETVTSRYDANDRILEQVDTVTGGPGQLGSTTTEFSYAGDGTQQTAETVSPARPRTWGPFSPRKPTRTICWDGWRRPPSPATPTASRRRSKS